MLENKFCKAKTKNYDTQEIKWKLTYKRVFLENRF